MLQDFNDDDTLRPYFTGDEPIIQVIGVVIAIVIGLKVLESMVSDWREFGIGKGIMVWVFQISLLPVIVLSVIIFRYWGILIGLAWLFVSSQVEDWARRKKETNAPK
ncbi:MULTISPECIES: hypothetical protein [Mameliella]|uniref:hypothetical protein n=1 Tax=Mameliella TaxID=1434019 RepID=UPI000B533E0F|nr:MULTISPECIES: hypothetical protein [Mameliella]MCR9276181.1 hypothetical protein [Paracoccaceae bacterium]OWV62931.1 hypothetical protein CDZ98_01805 [Mameliella alba]